MRGLLACAVVAIVTATAWSEPAVELPYKQTGPLSYGKHPSHTFSINYYPDGPPRALMVSIVSGGWNSSPIKKSGPIPPLYEHLGLASAQVSHRTIHDFPHPAQVDDVMAGIRYIRKRAKQWNIDPDRIAVTGRSSGGHLAMWVGFHPDAPDVAAVVERSGPSDFDPEFLKTFNPQLLQLKAIRQIMGVSADNPDPEVLRRKVKEFSPVTYMSADDPPTLFYANRAAPAKTDPPPADYGKHHHLFAEHGYKRYKAVGGVAELAIVDVNARGSAAASAAEEVFLRRHLLGEKDPVTPTYKPPARGSASKARTRR